MRTTSHQAYRIALVAFVTAISFATVSSTFVVAQVGAGNIDVNLSGSSVTGYGWSSGLPITVTVDDPATVESVDAIREGFIDPNGDFWFNFGSSIRIAASFVVTATSPDHTTSHVVLPLSELEADSETDTVSGVAAEGAELSAWVYSDTGAYRHFTVPAGDGSFVTPSFLIPAPSGAGDGLADLLPGTEGEVGWNDLAGNATRRGWHVPNPTITVEPFENRVLSNQDWPVGALVDVSVTGLVGCEQTVEVFAWGEGESGFEAWFDEATCDIVAGHTITADLPDGDFEPISRSVVVTDVEVTFLDEVNDLVMGYAALDSQVSVNGYTSSQGAYRDVIADLPGPVAGIGVWVADFTAAGVAFGDGVIDIAPGVEGAAEQHESDGDATRDHWGIVDPNFTVDRDRDQVYGGGWVGAVTIDIDDPSTTGEGFEPDFSMTTDVDEGQWFHVETWVDPDNGIRFDVEEGFEVTVTDSDSPSTSETLVVSGIEIELIDHLNGLVAGSASPNAQVDVWLSDGDGVTVTADGDGAWTTAWSLIPPYSGAGANEHDAVDDGNRTEDNESAVRIVARPEQDDMWGGEEWGRGETVTITIDDPLTSEVEVGPINRTVTQGEGGSWYFYVDIANELGWDLAPGQIVEVSSLDITKTHIVTGLTFVLDEANDLISGTANPGAYVEIIANSESEGAQRIVQADGLGSWEADLSDGGVAAAIQGDGAVDLAPGTSGAVREFDDDADMTWISWNILNPTVRVNPVDDYVTSNNDWPVGAVVTVDVNGGCVETPTVTESDGWSGFEVGYAGSCDIQPDNVVTATFNDAINGNIVAEVTVLDLSIETVNETTDIENPNTVTGFAPLGAQVNVQGGNHEQGGWRLVTANEPVVGTTLGRWAADFTEAGIAHAIQGDGWFEIAPGTGGEASISDAEGDETFVGWNVVNPQFTVQRDSGDVWGNGYEPNEPLTVWVDGADVSGEFNPDGDGNFGIWVGENIFAAGQQVIIGTKDHTVSAVAVTGLNPTTGEVSGIAEFGANVQVWIHESGAQHNTTASGEFVGDPTLGTWSVTFSTLSSGTEGAAAVTDIDGDQTQTDWRILNPTVRVNPVDDYVTSNNDWPVGAVVTVDVNGGCVETPTVTESDGWSGFEVGYAGSCDIQPDNVVTATFNDAINGNIVAEVTVLDLSIETVNETTDIENPNTVTGFAPLGAQVSVGGGNETQDGWRLVVASDDTDVPSQGLGRWIADFTEAGMDAALEGHGWFDIAPGIGGEASLYDPEGDETFVWWGINEPQLPTFTVQRDSGDVWGNGYDPNETLSVFVNGNSVYGPFEADENGDFGIWVGDAVTFAPEQLVKVGTKNHTVSAVEVTALDPASGAVSGVAEIGANVQVWIHGEDGGEGRETIANGVIPDDLDMGTWTVTFTELSPGTEGAAAVIDDDGDRTQTDWKILNPTIRVNPVDDYVSSNSDWPIGALVTVDINHSCVETVTVTEWDGWSSFDLGYDPTVCDIAVDDIVTATFGNIMAAVTVLDLSIEAVDETDDTVTGFAPLGAQVFVGGGNETQDGWRLVAAIDDTDVPYLGLGRWIADFTEAGMDAALEGDGWFDIAPGTGGEASLYDLEGDETFVWWGINEPQIPTFTVQRDSGDVWGGPEWIGPVTVQVGGDSYTVSVTEDGFFLHLSSVFDLFEGQTVTVTDNEGFSKTHVVTGLEVLATDAVTEAVHGSAYPDNGLYVWIDDHEVYRYVTAGEFWHVTFTEDGLAQAEEGNGTFDLVVGTRGGAAEIDDDGDWTQVEWEVTNSPPTMQDQPGQRVQYSDGIVPVTFTASDVDSDSLAFDVNGMPGSLTTSDSCISDGSGGVICTLTITGTVTEGAGIYPVTVEAVDPEGATTIAGVTIEVSQEDAVVQPLGGNPTAIPVESGNISGTFDLTFRIRHFQPDIGFQSTAGDLALSIPELVLQPVGPGSAVPGACGEVTTKDTDYDTHLTVTCSFDDVESNAYLVVAASTGDYFAATSNGVVVVYDPASGQVEGGGTFYWDGDLTEFGFTMEYNKKGKNLKGSFLLIRHTAEGDYVVKSNSLYGMATGQDGSTPWATFAGKATMTTPNGDTVGNHEFVVRVTDDPDTFWVEVLNKAGIPIGPLSMARDSAGQPFGPIVLSSGDLVVPKGKKNK